MLTPREILAFFLMFAALSVMAGVILDHLAYPHSRLIVAIFTVPAFLPAYWLTHNRARQGLSGLLNKVSWRFSAPVAGVACIGFRFFVFADGGLYGRLVEDPFWQHAKIRPVADLTVLIALSVLVGIATRAGLALDEPGPENHDNTGSCP